MAQTAVVLKVAPNGEKYVSLNDLIIHLQAELLELNKTGKEGEIDGETVLVHLINNFTRMKK